MKSLCRNLLASLLLLIGTVGTAYSQETDDKTLLIRQLPRDNLLLFQDEQGTQSPVRSLEDWSRRRNSILRGMQSVMGDLPGSEKTCELDVAVEEETDCGSFVLQSISYQSEPGSRTPAYLLIPKSALPPETSGNKPPRHPAVLCLHPTHVRGPDGIVGRIPNVDNQYGRELAERGYVVIAPNYPHLGKYQPDLKTFGWKSGTLKAVWDNKGALDLLDSLPYVQPGKYAAIGHSLGGHNSVYTAVFDDRLQVIISSCGLDSYVDYYNGNPAVWKPGQGWTQERYMPRLALYAGRLEEIPFDFHEMIGALAPRHTLIIAPQRDGNFRAESVDRIVAAARPIFELYKAADRLQVEHPPVNHEFPSEMRERAYQLIDSVLKQSNTPAETR